MNGDRYNYNQSLGGLYIKTDSYSDSENELTELLSREIPSVYSESEAIPDKDGRFHAPHDGFVWDGVVYKGGEYLPLEESQVLSTAKLKMLVSDVENLKNRFNNITTGKAWTVNGEQVCNAYFNVKKSIAQDITKLAPYVGKTLDLHSSEGNRGKAFNFNTRRMSKLWSLSHGSDDFMACLSMEGLNKVPFNFDKKGKLVSDWSGKTVSFNYSDGIYRI